MAGGSLLQLDSFALEDFGTYIEDFGSWSKVTLIAGA